ncbi:EmrB/QacA subfamily drug resistance transporter [Mumia flava]|uniref:EmrB/QacA subfamily drug resistance transporter n=1 Tax=Mumia flava TaxID=1348852 RepID=A0A0B2BJA4_9ACTN|nr:MDR family MFS transporter [Mumia flava]PJJ57347.1 EmrB/QacA subfamily drug resistance transporter [Mumia flava]
MTTPLAPDDAGPAPTAVADVAAPERGGIPADVWRLAMTLLVGGFAVVLNTTLISIALHDLSTQFEVSFATIQWISTGYLLALFATIPITGWAQRRFGGKQLWIAALLVFMLGSILCAIAWDATSLIAFRVVQGIGGGVLIPLMTTLIMQAARGHNLGRVMAVVGLPAALGPILGPVLGGLILEVASWPWLFLINIPFCVIGALLAITFVPRDTPDPTARLDVVGLTLLTPGVTGLIYALTVVPENGFGSAEVLVPLLAGIALVTAFAVRGLRRAKDNLVDLRLLRHRPLASASALGFLVGTALYGAMLLLPLYWQQVQGLDALDTALLLIPQGVGALLSRTPAGRLTDERGPRFVALTGFAIIAAATIPFAYVGSDTSNWLLGAVLLVRGLGLGLVTVPLTSAAFVGLDHHEVPSASIITRVTQQLGGSFGTAIFAVVLQQVIVSGHDLVAAFDIAFWAAAAAALVAIPLSCLLPGKQIVRATA